MEISNDHGVRRERREEARDAGTWICSGGAARELVVMLVDQGYAALDHDVVIWTGGPPAQVMWVMPPSVSALLAARIDRLGEEERAIIGAAAVVGTVFYAEAIAALTGTLLPEVEGGGGGPRPADP
jgi:hypothetical protein